MIMVDPGICTRGHQEKLSRIFQHPMLSDGEGLATASAQYCHQRSDTVDGPTHAAHQLGYFISQFQYLSYVHSRTTATPCAHLHHMSTTTKEKELSRPNQYRSFDTPALLPHQPLHGMKTWATTTMVI